jgi:hypothetical protein
MADKKIDYIQDKVDSVVDIVNRIDKAQALQQAAFETHTIQDEQMHAELRRMNDTLMLQHQSLKEHMENNVLLRDMIVKMDDRLSPIEKERLERAAVRKFTADKLVFLLKVAAAVGFLAGAWEWLWPSLSHLIK